jgi:hypothetical protein
MVKANFIDQCTFSIYNIDPRDGSTEMVNKRLSVSAVKGKLVSFSETLYNRLKDPTTIFKMTDLT